MKKFFIILFVMVVLGLGYWLVSPLFIDKEVSEISPIPNNNPANTKDAKTLTTENTFQLVASGGFKGFDTIHYGSGTASLIKSDSGYILRFEDNFSVANGPDLYVGLGKDGQYIQGSEIAKLKGNKGSQNYNLPQNFDVNATNEIWIWCKAFSVPFAQATLTQ